MFITTKNDITHFPFEVFATSENLSSTAKDYALPNHNGWMLPQLMSFFGSFKLFKNAEGKYDPISILKANIGSDPYRLGIWRVCTQMPRGDLIKSQLLNTRYSALVPLIMSGLKEYKGINYSEYATEGLEHLMGDTLYQAAMADTPILSRDRLLEIREMGLTIKSGKQVGTIKKATSAWCLTGIQNTELASVPKLSTTMLTQIWVADPSIRSPYMILDPHNWDVMPEPLISAEVLIPETRASISVPWL